MNEIPSTELNCFSIITPIESLVITVFDIRIKTIDIDIYVEKQYIRTIHANHIAIISDDHEGRDTSIFKCAIKPVYAGKELAKQITINVITDLESDYKVYSST